MSHHQEQGRAAYRRKDYAKALGHFDRAVGLTPSVQLLDNRAACYERLDNLPAALKDAKKTIQLGKADPTGYLRAGRILRKMGKKEVALEIYSYGLKCVKPTGQGYDLLRQAHGDLMSELSPTKSVDPLTLLPRELAEEVLDYLSFKQLMNTCLVSKQWAQFIRSSPNLWRHLDLGQARKRKVKIAFIQRAINVGRQKISAATLSMLFDFDKTLAALIRYCALDELVLANNGLQGDSLVDIFKKSTRLKSLRIESGTWFVGSQCLSQIMHNASNTLQSLQCDDIAITRAPGGLQPQVTFHHMRRLDLSWSREWAQAYLLMQDIGRFPNLQYLKLHQLKSFRHHQPANFDLRSLTLLEHVDIFLDIPDISILKLPETVKSLALGTFTRSPSYLAGQSALDWVLPNLEDLSISVNSLIFEDVVVVLERVTSSNPLRSLRLPKCELPDGLGRITPAAAVWKHPRLASLKHLGLEEAMGCDDVMIETLAECLGELESLNMSGTLTTGVGVKALAQKTKIQRLVANNCHAIGHDAVGWARQRGVQVEHRVTDDLGGGKKVRH